MPEREIQVSSVPLLTVGGVNQRVNKRELEDYEYTWLGGVAPIFSGSQTRLWGKSVLNKFATAVLGIYQFWTPMGYGVGLYQFNSSLDAGIWQSPITGITIPSLGLVLPFDAAGYTYDEFGYSIGGAFGYGTSNTCLLSFLNGNASHIACGPAASNVGTPDTTSNNPAGHGEKCKFTQVVTDYPISNFATLQQTASGGYNNQVFLDNVGTPPVCNITPTAPIPLGPPATVGGFTNVSPITSSFSASQNLGSASFFFVPASNPVCDFYCIYGPTGSATDTKFNLNFSSLVGPNLSLPTNITLVLTTSPGGVGEIPIGVDFSETGNFTSVNIQASSFLPTGIPVGNSDNGLNSNASVTGNTIRVYTYIRTCTPNA